MSKRYEPPKEFGRMIKKPKLDVIINKGRPAPAVAITKSVPVSNYNAPAPVDDTRSNLGNNFWDDDDDDVILLATQVAEMQAAVSFKASSSTIAESQITFSEFMPNIRDGGTTSTQRPSINEEVQIPDHELLLRMFNDEDDDDFDILPKKVAKNVDPNLGVVEQEFKKPMQFGVRTQQTVTATADTIPSTSQMPLSQSAARRQLASEREMMFLMERMDALKKENSKLNNNILEMKTQMESKDGEVSLLRDELRHTKQQMQSLKMEKIFSAEAAKSECKTKIAELAKQVEAKKTELQLKAVECSVLKMRHADDTKRFEMSMRDYSMMCNESMSFAAAAGDSFPMVEKVTMSQKRLRVLMRLRGLSIYDIPLSLASDNDALNLNELSYEPSHERGTTKRRRTIFQLELECLQTIVAQLQSKYTNKNSPTATEINHFVDKILVSICKVFSEFWTYVHSLEFPKNYCIQQYHECSLLDFSKKTGSSLQQPLELYEEERAVSLRRYIAVLAAINRQLPQLSLALLTHKHGEYVLLQIANDAICKLGFSREVCEHFGLLEAFATLLYSIILNVATCWKDKDAVATKCLELIVGLLKQLVFTRPTPSIFRVLSSCFLECVRLPQALEMFCMNSAENTFPSSRLGSAHRFTNDSCLLQVYSGLLETAFPFCRDLSPTHFENLIVICMNHVRFVYHCFAKPPMFIHRKLPSYDDDSDEADDATVDNDSNKPCQAGTLTDGTGSKSETTASLSSTSMSTVVAFPANRNKPNCQCYTKLCLSIVTLLFQVLRQWVRSDKKFQTPRITQISKIAVQLLHTIFCDNYLTCLFRSDEETTKYYLCLICKWWAENTSLLGFNDIHSNFLRKLQESHIMPKQISSEETRKNIDFDLKEWYQTSNDVCTKQQQAGGESDNEEAAASARRFMDQAADENKFFIGFKGYAFNFQ